MPRKRHSAEQIVTKLRQIEVLVAQGRTIGQACKEAEITEQSYYLYAAVRNSATEAAPYWRCGRRKTRPVVRLVPLGIGQDVCRGSLRRRSPVRIFGWS